MQAADAKRLTQAVEPESSNGEDTGSDELGHDSSNSNSANRKLSAIDTDESNGDESKAVLVNDTKHFRETLPVEGQSLMVTVGSYLFPPQSANQSSIPDEVAANVLSFLDPRELARASGVARGWYLETRRLLHFSVCQNYIYRPFTMYDDEMQAALTQLSTQTEDNPEMPAELKSLPTQVDELQLFEYLMAHYELEPSDAQIPLVLHEDGKVTGYALEGKPSEQFERLVAEFFTQRFPWFVAEVKSQQPDPTLSPNTLIESLIDKFDRIKPAIASWLYGEDKSQTRYQPGVTGNNLRRGLFDSYRALVFFKQPHYYGAYAILNPGRYDKIGTVVKHRNEQSFHHFVMRYLTQFLWKTRDLETLFTDVILLERTKRELHQPYNRGAQAAALPAVMQRLCHPLYCFRLSRHAITMIMTYEVFSNQKYLLDVALETPGYQVLLRRLLEEDWLVLRSVILPRPIDSEKPSAIFRALRDRHPIVVKVFTEKGLSQILQGKPQFIPFVLSNPDCLAKLSRKGFIEIASHLEDNFVTLYQESECFRQALIQYRAIGPIGYRNLCIKNGIVRNHSIYQSLSIIDYLHLFYRNLGYDDAIFSNEVISGADEERLFTECESLGKKMIQVFTSYCNADGDYEKVDAKPVIDDFTAKFDRWEQALTQRYGTRGSAAARTGKPESKLSLTHQRILGETHRSGITAKVAKPPGPPSHVNPLSSSVVGRKTPPEQSPSQPPVIAANPGISPHTLFGDPSKVQPTPWYIQAAKVAGYTVLIVAGLYFLSTGIGALITGFMLGITYSIAPYVIAAAGLELIATAALFILTRNPTPQVRVDVNDSPAPVSGNGSIGPSIQPSSAMAT